MARPSRWYPLSFAVRIYSSTCDGFAIAYEVFVFICGHVRDPRTLYGDDWNVARGARGRRGARASVAGMAKDRQGGPAGKDGETQGVLGEAPESSYVFSTT